MSIDTVSTVNLWAWVGLCVSFAVLLPLYWVGGLLGAEVFKRLRRVYHLTVIWYWLDRLERLGTHKFMRPHPDPNAHPLVAPPTTEEKDQP